MPTNILLQVPDSLRDYHFFLQGFFMKMIIKLDKNSWKETPTKANLHEIMDLLVDEVVEFEAQVDKNRLDINAYMELADIANFAFLAYAALRLEGVKNENKDTAGT
jgi:NTP pyrophosphatase (non-canonical NTP hydrolase)